MKFRLAVFAAFCAATLPGPLARAQDLDGNEVENQLTERETKIHKLTLEEQLKLRAAQKKAAEDPAVLEALAQRDKAIEEFRKALHDSMVKSDPKMEEILQKIAIGTSPGF